MVFVQLKDLRKENKNQQKALFLLRKRQRRTENTSFTEAKRSFFVAVFFLSFGEKEATTTNFTTKPSFVLLTNLTCLFAKGICATKGFGVVEEKRLSFETKWKTKSFVLYKRKDQKQKK